MAKAELAQEVRERPIIFGADSVRAILEGRKTQTRRVLAPQPIDVIAGKPSRGKEPTRQIDGRKCWCAMYEADPSKGRMIYCRAGEVGDLLWVRESWCIVGYDEARFQIQYRADPADVCHWRTPPQSPTTAIDAKWRTPIFMPRWASRITIELTDVRVEKLQDITGNDAREEGVCDPDDKTPRTGLYRIDQYREAWDELNAKRGFGWDVNPWVWVLSFRRVID